MNNIIEEIITKYHVTVVEENKIKIPAKYAEIAKKDNMIDTIISYKPLILNYFRNKEEAERRQAEEREAKIKAIEGLDEIMGCREAWAKWRRDFNHMMDTGSGVMSTPRPATSEKELRSKYPRANAYLAALAEANKSNFELSAIGNTALEKIINGEDYKQVADDMQQDISNFVNRHFYD